MIRVLEEMGEHYDRYFTMEQALQPGDAVNWLEALMVPAALLRKKSRDGSKRPPFEQELQAIVIPHVTFSADPQNSKLIHVTDDRLHSIKDYPLDKTLEDFSFRGTTENLLLELKSKVSPCPFGEPLRSEGHGWVWTLILS